MQLPGAGDDCLLPRKRVECRHGETDLGGVAREGRKGPAVHGERPGDPEDPRPARRVCGIPGVGPSLPAEGPRGARHGPALQPPGEGRGSGPEGAERRPRHPDGERQDPLLQPAGPPEDPRRARDPRPLPLPDQGPRPGPDARDPRPDRRDEGRHQDLHLRRGHPRRRPPGDPPAGARRRHEPRHAPRGDPSPPHQVAEALREPPVRGDRRAPRLPGGLRFPPDERAPASGPDLPLLRPRPGLHLLLGHGRQSPGSTRSGSWSARSRSSPRAGRPRRPRPSSSTTRPSSTGSSGSASPP